MHVASSAACSNLPAGFTARSSPPVTHGGTARTATIGDITPSSAYAHSQRLRDYRSCRGRRPIGGHILGHDFVEAALMRRAGWAIYMAPELRGSFEEVPPVNSRFCRQGPAMVSRQPSTHRRVARARPTLGLTGSPAHRDRFLYYGPNVVDLPDLGIVDFTPGQLHPTGILSEGLLVVSHLAAAGSRPSGLGVCRHDGTTHGPKLLAYLGLNKSSRRTRGLFWSLSVAWWNPFRNVAWRR